ncbi:hypothetical protein H696_05921 [Fonticula alba]|uniref:LIM zinc-binding domain-containing protein n=1 Tax=Fonticula alba TaxID=691883 RepID=A0A058Z040_FONAL|nr:hypothetical protein H696_05921 [Fonticula alba]KCV67634.1 hypothetical protein H696_05921 [Fonticula alba]|eukprot:XP_009497972.1 hypothetical protein H696_05921 [Fonticula alba]
MSPPDCSVCRLPITGQMISASNQALHPECFVCVQCLMPFPEGSFYESPEPVKRLYCPDDFQKLFGMRCAKCGESIAGRCITALDMKWHPEHFSCAECGDVLSGSSFVRRLNKPYCKPCSSVLKERALQQTRSTCAKCQKPIMSKNELIVYQRERYHARHFSCHSCSSVLTADCKELDDKLYCQPCHQKALSATCDVCRRPIDGRSISALGKQFHPEHFVCTRCEKPFGQSSFFEYEGKPYCEIHFNEVRGAMCGRCLKSPQEASVPVFSRHYCRSHMVCVGCEVSLLPADIDPATGKLAKDAIIPPPYYEWDLKPFCKNCFGELPSSVQRRLTKYAELERKYLKKHAK